MFSSFVSSSPPPPFSPRYTLPVPLKPFPLHSFRCSTYNHSTIQSLKMITVIYLPTVYLLLLTLAVVLLVSFVLARRQVFWARMVVCAVGISVASMCGFFFALYCYFSTSERASANYYTGKIYYHFTRPFLGIRYQVVGDLEALDVQRNGPYVAVCNHQSSLDILSMGAFWPKRLSVVAKDDMRWYPFLGWYMILAENVFVRRSDRARAIEALRDAGLELQRRQIGVFLFPEGTRSRMESSGLLPFKKGAFHMALKAVRVMAGRTATATAPSGVGQSVGQSGSCCSHYSPLLFFYIPTALDYSVMRTHPLLA